MLVLNIGDKFLINLGNDLYEEQVVSSRRRRKFRRTPEGAENKKLSLILTALETGTWRTGAPMERARALAKYQARVAYMTSIGVEVSDKNKSRISLLGIPNAVEE